MNRSTLRRTGGIAALVLSTSLGLAACGSEAEDSAAAAEETSQAEQSPSEEPMDEGTDGMADPAAQTYGEGCSAVPTDGAGSFDGMASEPVATAASANPLLTTLVSAVGEAGLVDTLNSAPAITVFAPTDDAFAAIPKKDLDALLADKEALTGVLTHHVVEGRLAPDDLGGELTTLAGDTLMVDGEGEAATIGDEQAAVLCGNVPTANATVYVIDSVLMPAKG